MFGPSLFGRPQVRLPLPSAHSCSEPQILVLISKHDHNIGDAIPAFCLVFVSLLSARRWNPTEHHNVVISIAYIERTSLVVNVGRYAFVGFQRLLDTSSMPNLCMSTSYVTPTLFSLEPMYVSKNIGLW